MKNLAKMNFELWINFLINLINIVNNLYNLELTEKIFYFTLHLYKQRKKNLKYIEILSNNISIFIYKK